MISFSFEKKEFILAYGSRGRGHNGRRHITADKKEKEAERFHVQPHSDNASQGWGQDRK